MAVNVYRAFDMQHKYFACAIVAVERINEYKYMIELRVGVGIRKYRILVSTYKPKQSIN